MKIEANIEGRLWMMEQQASSEAARADLKSRGFDGEVFLGESLPIGRQRAKKYGMFYRSPKGHFVPVVVQ